MKKYLMIVIFFILVGLCGYAQTQLDIGAGNFCLGGVMHFEFEYNSTNPLILVQISPAFGYFITDNLMLATSLFLSFQGGTGVYENKYNPLSVGVGARYLFSTKAPANFYIGLNAAFGLCFTGEMKFAQPLLVFSLPLGILIPIRSELALDIGTAPTYKMGFEPFIGYLNIPVTTGFVVFF
jgi:hypothetical protein